MRHEILTRIRNTIRSRAQLAPTDAQRKVTERARAQLAPTDAQRKVTERARAQLAPI